MSRDVTSHHHVTRHTLGRGRDVLWQMSRSAGLCHDGCCQLSPVPGLRGKCDTELIWPPEADAEAELRPGPGPGPRLQSLVWSRPESQPRPGQAQPLEAVWAPGAASHSPHRQQASSEGRGWDPHVVSSNHPNLNNAYGSKHINCPQTNITWITRDF